MNAAGIKAFYFKDPDHHALEILWFPPGKGDPKWHRPAATKLFLGIDHTAIVVNDTEASLKFYREALGLKQVAESENYGVEQKHLNNAACELENSRSFPRESWIWPTTKLDSNGGC